MIRHKLTLRLVVYVYRFKVHKKYEAIIKLRVVLPGKVVRGVSRMTSFVWEGPVRPDEFRHQLSADVHHQLLVYCYVCAQTQFLSSPLASDSLDRQNKVRVRLGR